MKRFVILLAEAVRTTGQEVIDRVGANPRALCPCSHGKAIIPHEALENIAALIWRSIHARRSSSALAHIYVKWSLQIT